MLRESRYPAGHCDRNTIGSQFTVQREHHLGSDACERYAAARRRISFSCFSTRVRFFASRSAYACAWVHSGLTPSSTSAILSQRWGQDSEIPKSFAIRLTGASPPPGDRDPVLTEPLRQSYRDVDHIPARTETLTVQESTKPTAAPQPSLGECGGFSAMMCDRRSESLVRDLDTKMLRKDVQEFQALLL